MHCPQCGLYIDSPTAECPSCHTSLKQNCPYCRYRNLIGQQFCGQCGADMMASSAPQGFEAAQTAKSEQGDIAHYPVLSVELMHLEQLLQLLRNADQQARVSHDLMIRIESQLLAQNATIISIRDNVMFLTFRQEASLGQALSKALKIGIALSKKEIQIQSVTLGIRVGMDIASGNQNDPTIAVPERTMGRSGDLIVSQKVYDLTQKQVPYEALGPIQVHGSMRTVFKTLMDALPLTVASENAPSARPLQPATEPAPKTAPPPEDDWYHPPSSQPISEAAYDTPVPPEIARTKPNANEGFTAPPEPPPPAQPTNLLKPLSAKTSTIPPIERKFEPEEQPLDTAYEAPVFLAHLNQAKPANIDYLQLLEILKRDFAAWPAQQPHPTGKIIGIVAPSGAGKTYILNRVRSELPPEDLIWIAGHFAPPHADNPFPFGYWLDLVQTLMGFPPDGVHQTSGAEHLVSVLAQMMQESMTPDVLNFFKMLLSIDPVRPITPEVRLRLGSVIQIVGEMLARLTESRPVVMLMENVDVADVASLELLTQLMSQHLFQLPITLIMTYSPNLVFTNGFQELIAMVPFKEYVLDPCDESTMAMIAEIPLSVPWAKLPDRLRTQLIDKGSPLFFEEAFRWLLLKEGFSIENKTGKFKPEKNLKNLTVPEDVRQIVYDRFMAQDKVLASVLQMASVLGERFSISTLADLSQLQSQFDHALQVLLQHGFLMQDSEQTLVFRHTVIWETIYQTIPADVLPQLHQVVADYLGEKAANGFGITPVLRAQHLAWAGNMTASIEAWQQAGAWLAWVGTISGANIAFLQVLNLLSRANMDTTSEKHLYETLGILNVDLYPDHAKHLFLKALKIDPNQPYEEQIQNRLFLSQAYDRLGDYPQAIATLHRAYDSLAQHGSPLERLALGAQEVWFLFLQGKFQEALYVYNIQVQPWVEKEAEASPWALPYLRMLFGRAELARARIALAQCSPEAFDIIDETLPQCEFYKETELALHFRIVRCEGFLLKGNYERCQREMNHLFTDIQDLQSPPELVAWWGWVMMNFHIALEDWQSATLLLPNTSYQAELARHYLLWCLCQDLAGQISLGNGNNVESQVLIEKAVTTAAEYHLSAPALLGWRLLAENELSQAHYDAAETLVVRALDIAEKPTIQNALEAYYLRLTMAKISIARADYKGAGVLIEKHWGAMVQSGYTPLIAEAAYQISELYRRLADTLPPNQRPRYISQSESFRQKAITLWEEQGNQTRLRKHLPHQQGVAIA